MSSEETGSGDGWLWDRYVAEVGCWHEGCGPSLRGKNEAGRIAAVQRVLVSADRARTFNFWPASTPTVFNARHES
jgi:hypothetical protein